MGLGQCQEEVQGAEEDLVVGSHQLVGYQVVACHLDPLAEALEEAGREG